MKKLHLGVLGLLFATLFVPIISFAQTATCPDLITINLKLNATDATSNGEISKLQRFLSEQAYFTQNPPAYLGALPTGSFFSATQQALKNFESAEGLPVTGTATTTTRERINGISCGRIQSAWSRKTEISTQPKVLAWKSSSIIPKFIIGGGCPSPMPPGGCPPPKTNWDSCDPPPPYAQTKLNAGDGVACTDPSLSCVTMYPDKHWTCGANPAPGVISASTGSDGREATAATLTTSVNPFNETTSVWFRYSATNPGTCNDTFGTRAPASGGTTLSPSISPLVAATPISGLTQNTTYYFCAIASNVNGKSFGGVATLKTIATGYTGPVWTAYAFRPIGIMVGATPPTCATPHTTGEQCALPANEKNCLYPPLPATVTYQTTATGWQCVAQDFTIPTDIVGRVIDYATGLGVGNALVSAGNWAYFNPRTSVYADALGNYRIFNWADPDYMEAQSDGYSKTAVIVPKPVVSILENGKMVVRPADISLVNQRDPNYVGPLVDIQYAPAPTTMQPIASLNGTRTVLFDAPANFTFKGLGPNGKMCTMITSDVDATRIVIDKQYCNRLPSYKALDTMGFTYNATTDEWSGTIVQNLANGFNLNTVYTLALYNPGNPLSSPAVLPKAASYVVTVTPFESGLVNLASYRPMMSNGVIAKPRVIAPAWGDSEMYIGGSVSRWTQYLNTPTEISVVGTANNRPSTLPVGTTVKINYEVKTPPRAGDTITITPAVCVITAAMQGKCVFTMMVAGLARSVFFQEEVSGRSAPGYAMVEFNYSGTAVGNVLPTKPLPTPTLSAKNQETGATAQNGTNVDFLVGQTAVYKWTGGCPVGRTCTYSSTAIAMQDATPGAASCSANLAQFDARLKVGLIIPWTPNQTNGANGGETWPIYPFQMGCQYILSYTVTTNEGMSKTLSLLLTVRSSGSGAAPSVTGIPTPTLTTKNDASGTIATDKGQVSAKVGETLTHTWSGGCPGGKTCTYASEWTATGASCQLTTVGLVTGQSYPWSMTQVNGTGGSQTVAIPSYQGGCTFKLTFTATTSDGKTKTLQTGVVVAGEASTQPVLSTGKVYNPRTDLLFGE